MTISKIVRYGSGVLIAVLLLGAALAASGIDTIRMGGPIQTRGQQASDLVADILPPPAYIIEAHLETTLLRQHPEQLAEHRARLAQLERDFHDRQAFWRQSDLDASLRAGLTERAAAPALAYFSELNSHFLPAIAARDGAAIDRSYAVLTKAYGAHRKLIDATVTAASTYQKNLNAEAATKVGLVSTLLIGIGVLVLGLVAGASWAILARVVRPLSQIAGVTTRLAQGETAEVPFRDRGDELGEIAGAVETFRMAAADRADADARSAAEQEMVVQALVVGLDTLARGDLTSEIRADFPPAFTAAKDNFQSATSNLRHMIQAVVENADSIKSGTLEIAQATEDLARRTESNAASLEQTSAALAQIDARLRTTTTASIDTVARADRAIVTVGDGRTTAADAVAAMGRVSGSAKGIDSVIEGLDKIAFQTRVLAMNAAVEAGRAGDAGRGFAVVADLVSALAMRAEEEAKRARDQLTVTQAEIISAVNAVERVDGALGTIAGDVDEVHRLLGGIAEDNRAQSLAITEITAAVGAMDRATQQNAAMVEETSATTRTLNGEVEALAASANRFTFERRTSRMPVPVDRRKLAQDREPPAVVRPAIAPRARAAAAVSRPAIKVVASDEWQDF